MCDIDNHFDITSYVILSLLPDLISSPYLELVDVMANMKESGFRYWE